MKKYTSPFIFAVFSIICSINVFAQTDLLSLADPAAFGPQVGNVIFTGTGSQTSSGFSINGAINSGDLIYGVIASSQNWSSYVTSGMKFSLYMAISAPNPNVPFSLEFFDSSDGSVDIWSGTTGATASSGYFDLDLTTPGTGVYSDIKSLMFTWANASTENIDTTISSVAVVPEPSTYALLAMSAIGLGGYAVRRRRR